MECKSSNPSSGMIRSRSFVIRDKAFSVQEIADSIRISMILASSGYALSISEYVYLLLKALKLRSLVKSLLSKKFEYSSYKDDEARKIPKAYNKRNR